MSKLTSALALAVLSLAFASEASAAAKKKGLLVLLENGGVKANLPDLSSSNHRVRLPLASCGTLGFALNPGESPAQMVARLGTVIADNPRCLNPRAWRVQQVDFETFSRINSDLVIEEVAKGLSMAQNARGLYDRIVVLEDAQMNPTRALSELRRLAPSHIIDVHVLAHGAAERFIGGKPAPDEQAASFGSGFFEGVKKIGGLELGAVYQMNCVSGTLTDNWRDAGAKVVNGTIGHKNNYMPQQYYHFMRHWLGGARFDYAIAESYKESSLYSLPAYGAFGYGQYVSDSRHIVEGLGNLTAKPHKTLGYVVEEGGKKTVWELAEALHAQGKTVAQMVSTLLGAGYDLQQATRAVARATSHNTRRLVRGLLEAGRDFGETIAAVKAALGGDLDEEQLCQALFEAGRTPEQVATLLQTYLGRNRVQVARLLRSSGRSARQVARALKRGMHATTQQVADTLKAVSFSAGDIAAALKQELNTNAEQTALALKRAGYTLTAVTTAMKSAYGDSMTTLAKSLKSAGFTLTHVARALWNASQKTPASLNSLAQALASAYSQTLAQVLATLSSIDITA